MLSIVWIGWIGQRREDELNEERENVLDNHKHMSDETDQFDLPSIDFPCTAHRGRKV